MPAQLIVVGYNRSPQRLPAHTCMTLCGPRLIRVYFNKTTDSPKDYLVDHSIIHYLIDPEGEFVTFYGEDQASTFPFAYPLPSVSCLPMPVPS